MQIKLEAFLSFSLEVVMVMCKIQYQLYLHTINPHSATHHFGPTFIVAFNVNF